MGRFLGRVFYRLRIRKTLIVQNLRLAFPSSGADEIRRLVRANYEHYGHLLIEFFTLFSWGPDDFRTKMDFEGAEHLREMVRKGQGGFLITFHFGSFESALLSVPPQGVPMDVIVKRVKSSSVFNRLLEQCRMRTGARILYESGSALQILRILSQNRIVAFVVDQFMGPPIGIPVRFFGQPAGTVASIPLLTETRDVPVVIGYCLRMPSGRLKSIIEPQITFPALAEDRETRIYQKTQFLNDLLEERVRRHPEQWFWIHKRWKPFRGRPKWLPKLPVTVTATALLLSFLTGCTMTGERSTGIAIPDAPEVATPEFQQSEQEPDAVPLALAAPTKPSTKEKMVSDTKPIVSTALPVLSKDKTPFEIGERMEFDISWTALPAGRLELEVKNGPAFGKRPTYHLWGHIRSSRIVDAIYSVDNTIESFVDKQAFIPYRFLLHMVETPQLKETRVVFDHTKNEAHYWSKRISKKFGDQVNDRKDTFEAQARDMFSAFYYARYLNYKLNQMVSFLVYENGQNLKVELLPVKNESVRTPAGAFQCWKVKVVLKINNVLKPTGDVFAWLSDDSRKYLVKFDSKLRIGSLQGTLVGLREKL